MTEKEKATFMEFISVLIKHPLKLTDVDWEAVDRKHGPFWDKPEK